ncbi:phage tail protein [bacterium]|nr:phage tail protein [bacterium]
MADRNLPYGAFNFVVEMPTGRDSADALGGFSEVTGIGTEMTVAEYRNGNALVNHVQKVPGIFKTNDVTLKRGVVNSADFWGWINEVRRTGPAAKRPNVTITLRDETGAPKQRWQLRNVFPMKYTGPSLNAKGGQDVAMEELVLSAEQIDFEAV